MIKESTINTFKEKNENVFFLPNLFIYFLIFINVISIFGYATFSLNPQLLSQYEWAAKIYSYSYSFFARLQIIASFIAIAILLYKKYKYDWIKDFIWVFAISMFMEEMGTTFGVPFGKYEYTDLLGWKFLDKVPYLIPISWFFMAIPSYAIAIKAQSKMDLKNKFSKSFFNVLFASLVLSTWDLTLDPAMSHLSPFWLWETKGIYYGTPLINLFGWMLTGLFIMIGFEFLNTQRLIDRDDQKWNLKFYLVNLSLPIGLVLCSQIYLPIFLTAICFGLVYVISNYKKIFKLN